MAGGEECEKSIFDVSHLYQFADRLREGGRKHTGGIESGIFGALEGRIYCN